jgi:hypothetical protein
MGDQTRERKGNLQSGSQTGDQKREISGKKKSAKESDPYLLVYMYCIVPLLKQNILHELKMQVIRIVWIPRMLRYHTCSPAIPVRRMRLLPKFVITCLIISGARGDQAQGLSKKLGNFFWKKISRIALSPLTVKEAVFERQVLTFYFLPLHWYTGTRLETISKGVKTPQVDRYKTTHFL